MNKRTALRVTLCASLVAMTYWPGQPMTNAAHAAEPPPSTANEPQVTTPPRVQDEHDPAGRESGNAAAGIRPPAEEQTGTDHPRLRGIGRQRLPREEPDVGFGGPSRTRDTATEMTR